MALLTPWLHQIDLPDASLCLVIGRTELAQIDTLLKQYPRGVFWILDSHYIDPSSTIPQNLALYLMDDPIAEDFEECISSFIHLDPLILPSLKITFDTEGKFNNLYEEVLIRLRSILAANRNARNTRTRFAFQKQDRFFKNLIRYVDFNLPDGLSNQAKSIPALIIGSGPSLEVTLPLAKALTENCLTFVSDSASKATQSSGVRQDFVINIDNVKTPALTLPKEPELSCLVTTPESSLDWNEVAVNWRLLVSGRAVTFDWLEDKGIKKTSVIAESNVGATAIKLAAFLGCNPIILIGLDYASSPGNASETHHSLAYRPEESQRSAIGIPGNYSDKVPSIYYTEWNDTAKIVEELAETHTIYNINDRGAKLDGAILLPPSQTEISSLCNSMESSLAANKIMPILMEIVQHKQNSCDLNLVKRQILEICEQVLDHLKRINQSKKDNLMEGLRMIFLNKDASGIFGYYSMKVIPLLLRPELTTRHQLEEVVSQLKDLCKSAIKAIGSEIE